jgi:hypothetical protein
MIAMKIFNQGLIRKFIQNLLKNAGYCEAVPASGYQIRYNFVLTFFNQGLVDPDGFSIVIMIAMKKQETAKQFKRYCFSDRSK